MEYLDYPKEKVDIFSPCDKNYFLKSDRFSYLCSYEEAENIDKYNSFKGSFVLITYKRFVIVKGGKVIYQNKDFDDGNVAKGRYKGNGYVIISDTPKSYYIQSWDKYLESYEIRDDSEYNKALNPIIYSSCDDAVGEAVAMSQGTDGAYIVAQWFNDIDRH